MDLALTTDYAADTGDAWPYLKRIADAGFSYVHWCHHWNTDLLYSRWEIEQIGKWLADYGLRLLDLHGSVGREKNWASPREHERRAGVELIQNRIEMTARLGGHVTILHVPADGVNDPLRRSLDELEAFARGRGVRIAIENGNFGAVRQVLTQYGADYAGLCYDAGHGNVDGDGLDQLDALKDRLISVHLHDNDGNADQHKPLFSGTVDWLRVAQIMAASAYANYVSMEVIMRHAGMEDEVLFLKHVFETGVRFDRMIEDQRHVRQA